MSETKGSFYEVNGCPIYYEIHGSGPNPVLMIPGGIGAGITDFEEQLEGDYQIDFDKFTLVVVDPPGWGQSRPPARKYDINFYKNDCDYFHQIMQHLGYEKYSIIGFSHGAKVGLLMAINYRESVLSLVITALSTYVSEKGQIWFGSTKSIQDWSEDRISTYLKVYESKEVIQKLWTKFATFLQYYNSYFPQDLYLNRYHLVKCSVLVFHGDRDQMIEVSQPMNVVKNLKKATLHRIPNAAHDLHQKYSQTFKEMTEKHLLNKNNENSNALQELDMSFNTAVDVRQ